MYFQLSSRYQNICFATLSLKSSAAGGFRKQEETIRKTSPVYLAAIQQAFTHKGKALSKKISMSKKGHSKPDQIKENNYTSLRKYFFFLIL